MAELARDLSDELLVERVLSQKRDLVEARFQHSMGQLENSASLRDLRRGIAKLLTEMRSREIAQGLCKDTLLTKHRTASSAPADDVEESAETSGFLKGIVDKLTG
jgi:large subunit ribosomal protein L29